MKNSKIFVYAALALSAFGMQSCLDYDTPGDELNANQETTETIVSSGKADVIDYRKEISAAELKQATREMRTQLGSALKAIYSLRGGKDGNAPAAHAYQFAYSLGPDNYVQYFCVPHSDFPYSNFTLRSTYDMCKGSIGGPGAGFSAMKLDMAPTLNASKIDYMPEIKAIFLMLFNYSAIENADLFGPMPYTDFKNLKEESPFTYDDVKKIYYKVEADLDTAINCFKYYAGQHLAMVDKEDADGNPIYVLDSDGNKIVLKTVAGKDSVDADGNLVYKTEKEEKLVDNRSKDYKKQIGSTIKSRVQLLSSGYADASDLSVWIRFANSLKLRMAIHMTGVDPVNAKKWAEEAVDPENGGVIEEESDEIALYVSKTGTAHPLVEITGSWHDAVIGASFMNLLENLDHPYMKYLFTKNEVALAKSPRAVSGTSAPAVTPKGSVYVGMRNGVTPGIGQAAAANPYAGYSTLDKDYFSNCQPPLYFMKVSEVCFLRAEGAIRGWNMQGEAKEFYEKGIRTAYLEDRNSPYKEYTQYVEQYLNVDTPKDIPYVDPQGRSKDMQSVTKVGVKWNDGDSQETKLEKIITQKYIASFPYSYESWVDLRRVGYPKLFPILGTRHGDGSIKLGKSNVQTAVNIMRRIPWASDDPQTKEDIANSGLPALARDADMGVARDIQMQHLWWDNGASNFETTE